MGFVVRDQPPQARRRDRRIGWFGLLRPRALAGLLVAATLLVPGAATATTTWSRNLFMAQAFLYQDPYPTACTAAATMMMLNTIAYRGTGGDGFRWAPSRIKADADASNRDDMLSILAFARANDTLRASSRGSDPHGWRNALNAYGWGEDAMTDASRRVYEDRAYRSFKGAVRAAVRAIARRSMPVGILGWAGRHAQVMTGYVVTGADPRVSNDFIVRAVYLSDPLVGNGTVNRRVSIDRLRSGPLRTRFQAYREADSPYDDRWTEGKLASSVLPSRGRSEWYRRWVVLLPIRQGLPAEAPSAEPTPGPDPDPTPTPEPDATAADTGSAPDAAPDDEAGSDGPAPTEAPAPRETPTETPRPAETPAPREPDPTGTPVPREPDPTATAEAPADGGEPATP